MSLGEIKTGITSTLKIEAEDAGAKAKAIIAKEEQEMDKVEVAADEVMYQTLGEPVFNCRSVSGKPIVFKAGRFICLAEDSDFVDALDHFVSINRIEKV